jgi:hypothetical protein
VTIHPPHIPDLDLWSPDAYEGLTRDFEARKNRYLSMLVESDSTVEPGKRLAQARGYLITPAPTPAGPGSVRLRTDGSPEWHKRLTPEDRKRADARYTKPYTSSWTDDPVVRARPWWQPAIENTSMAIARLTFPPADTFSPPFGPPVTDTAVPQPLKLVVNTVFSFDVARIDGGLGVRALVEALLAAVENAVPTQVPQAELERLERALKEWFDTLHIPVAPAGSALPALLGLVPGYDPLNMGRHLGVPLTEAVFAAAAASQAPEIRELTDTLAWLASQADLPFSSALASVADWVSFGARPLYQPLLGVWALTGGNPNFGPPPGTDGLPLTGRILSCAERDRPPVFRCDTDVAVPAGWSWPTCDATGCYWWRAVLAHSVVQHILRLKDTADFHVTDVLRLVLRHRLYTATPDPRVPRFVADSIKGALLQFKYWLDEPPATGEGGGEMTFWSENHQILFHSCELLVGQLFPDDVFPRSGLMDGGAPVNGREHARRGAERTRRWLDRRLRFGFSEWCSPGYYNEDFPPLLNLADFANDPGISTKAAMVLDRLVFDLVRFTTRGSFASSAGRAYFEHKAFGWSQSVGETVELLTGARGDHIGVENTAVALCTAERYTVPEVLLAVARDREQLDRHEPFADHSRTSVTWQDGRQQGIGTTTPDDVAFWWGLGGYFTDELRDSTRRVAQSHPNLRKSPPMKLLWALDDALPGFLDALGPYVKALLLDAATVAVASGTAAGLGLASALLPFPLNLVFGLGSVASAALTVESLINVIHDLGKMLVAGLEAAWAAITGDDPPEPEIPTSVLQQALESMLELFNRGNLLSRANLRTFSIADAMLSSVQVDQPGQISFQKQPWIASLGCDVSVWTNAPMTAGGTVGSAGWQLFKHLLLLQGAEAMTDVAKLAGLAGMDDLRKEGLYEWGGSLSLPRVVQHREAAVIIYNFDDVHRTMSRTPTHAWFPCGFFDEVDPAPSSEAVLPERDAGGTWVFGRNADGYLALFSARPVHWVRDGRFDADPDPFSAGTMGDAGFTSTELRADNGSNVWVCIIGSKRRHGSFAMFKQAVRDTYLDVSGVGTLSSLACELDVPGGVDPTVGGFRLDVHDEDDGARVDGQPLPVSELPLMSNRYVSGTRAGQVEWGENRYAISHPSLDLWVEHDLASGGRTASPPQENPALALPTVPGNGAERRTGRFRLPTATGGGPPPPVALGSRDSASPRPDRRRRFRLEPAGTA